jgi:hypothetical protein
MMLSGQALAMTSGQWIVLSGGGPRRPAPVTEATCQEVIVSQVRVHNFSVSLDGFGTGAGHSLDAPSGHAGTRLYEWFFPARTFRAMQGQPGGSTGTGDAFAGAWEPGIGAEIMGAGQVRPAPRIPAGPGAGRLVGRHPAVPHPGLCPHPPSAARGPRWTAVPRLASSTPAPPGRSLRPARPPRAPMSASAAAPSTIREFLAAGLIDYAHIVVVPIVLGRGERLWDGLEGLEERFQIEAVNSPGGVTHVTLSRR